VSSEATRRSVVALGALLFLFGGCSASGPSFNATRYATQQAPVDRARIIFFRTPDINYRSVTITIDGDEASKLAAGGFLIEEIEPGLHVISASVRLAIGDYRVRMNVKAGETYYIRVSPREEREVYAALSTFSAAGTVLQLTDNQGFFKLQLAEPKVALRLLQDLRFSE
jgi:hypothetical protein